MNRKYITQLVDELFSLRSKSGLEDFLKGVLTPKELDEISTRLQIVKMLKKGVPQHTIAEKLGVGIATVTRGSKELAQGRFKSVTPTSWR